MNTQNLFMNTDMDAECPPEPSLWSPHDELPRENRPSISAVLAPIRYEKPIDDDEEEELRRWHADDPVDEAERRRAAAATEVQGNANPFIDDPMLVSRIADF